MPVEHNEAGFPVVHATVEDAERSIVEDLIERLGQYKAGERDFDDAITVEEYIVPVDVTAEGAIIDADGNCFGKSC